MEEDFDDKHKKIGGRPLGISGFIACGFKINIESVMYAGTWSDFS